MALPMMATPVSGEANIGGVVDVSGSTINFHGVFTALTGGLDTGSFSGLADNPVTGNAGTIMSLSGGAKTGTVNIPDFIVFTGLATPINFDLTYINAGYGTLAGCSSSAVGSACTLPGSPITLTEGPTGTTATLFLSGQAYTGTSASGSSSATVGSFTTQVTINDQNQTIPQIVADLMSGGAIVGQSYSATFVATPNATPEPASLMLVGAGLLGAGLISRRRKSRS